MSKRKTATLAAFILFSIIGCHDSHTPSDRSTAAAIPAWRPLFNGRDFSGWYTFLKGLGKNSDPDRIFQVDDGMIHIYKDAADGSRQPFGYLCTSDEYGDCRVRLEYKWGTKRFAPREKSRRDSGLLYFVTGEDGLQGGVWPQSVECQIQENDVGDVYAIRTVASTTIDRATASAKQPTFKEQGDGGVPYTTPGGANDRIVRSQMLEHDGWNSVEVLLQGDRAVHIINGIVNMRIEHVQRQDPADPTKRTPLRRGRILLQAEGAEVWFRKVEVRPLR